MLPLLLVEQGKGTSHIQISPPLVALGRYRISASFKLFPHSQGVQSECMETYNKRFSRGLLGLQVNELKIQNPFYITG